MPPGTTTRSRSPAQVPLTALIDATNTVIIRPAANHQPGQFG
jgi:hypothetical protein